MTPRSVAALASIFLLAAAPVGTAQLDQTYEVNDLMLFFKNPNGNAGTTAYDTVGVSLGSTWAKFRKAATPGDPTYGTVLSLGNINSILTETYDEDWTGLTGTIFAGAVGQKGSINIASTAISDGDYARTAYITKPRTGPGTPGSANSSAALVPLNNSAGVASAIQGGNSSLTWPASVNPANNVSPGIFLTPTTFDYNPLSPTGAPATAYTAISGGVMGLLKSSGNTFTFGDLTEVAMALDLYRVTPVITGAAAWQNVNNISGVKAGTGYYLGTITVRANGDLHFTAVGAAAGDDYSDWAAGYAPADLSDKSADYDQDGFTNGTEYAFGTNPTLGNASLTSVSRSSGNILVTYLQRAGVDYAVQKTAALGTAFVTDASILPSRFEPQGTVPAGYEKVFFSQPASGKSFYRVQAELP